MHTMSWILIELLLLFGSVQCQELRYALFTAGPSGGFDSSGAVPAIELAEEMINADSSILPGYNLTHTVVYDTKCDRTASLNQYFDTISPPNPTILGLLGCGCSSATTPVAEIVHHYSISQDVTDQVLYGISYISASIELTDRRRFPNLFRIFPSAADFIEGIVAFIQYYGWKQIAILSQDGNLFSEAIRSGIHSLTEINVRAVNRIVSQEGFNDSELETLFESEDYRIIFVNTHSNLARQIFCKAYLRGLTYPRYLWMTYSWFNAKWWTEEMNSEPVDCSDEQLAMFIQTVILIDLLPRNDIDIATDIGVTSEQVDSLYQARLSTEHARENNYTYTLIASVAYDALWTLALALNRTNEMVQSLTREEILNTTQCEGSDENTGTVWELVSLENFTYSNQLMGCIVRWNLERTDFFGVSGKVSFNNKGSREKSVVKLFQNRLTVNDTLSKTLFAYAMSSNQSATELVYVDGESTVTVFPGGIPSDGTPVDKITSFHLSLVIVYYILAVAGLLFTTACLVFNFTQRNKKVVKLTSPNINYFVIVGAYLLYLHIFFRVLPSTSYAVNSARCIIVSLFGKSGYSVGYAAVLGKMIRIYYIFHNPTASKKILKDWKVVLLVLLISGIGVLLTVLQVSIPHLRPTPVLTRSAEYGNNSRNDLGIRTNHLVYLCYEPANTPQSTWLGVIHAYQALLQVIGIVLAIQTRKVKIKLLNDSKYIAIQIYSSSIALFLLVLFTFTLESFPNIGEGIVSGGLFIGSTIFLGLVFLPKVVSLYRDPHGERVLNTASASNVSPTTFSLDIDRENTSTVTQLQSRIAELESMLMECEIGQGVEFNSPTQKPCEVTNSETAINGSVVEEQSQHCQ